MGTGTKENSLKCMISGYLKKKKKKSLCISRRPLQEVFPDLPQSDH